LGLLVLGQNAGVRRANNLERRLSWPSYLKVAIWKSERGSWESIFKANHERRVQAVHALAHLIMNSSGG
jgi:hypothetical protein